MRYSITISTRPFPGLVTAALILEIESGQVIATASGLIIRLVL